MYQELLHHIYVRIQLFINQYLSKILQILIDLPY